MKEIKWENKQTNKKVSFGFPFAKQTLLSLIEERIQQSN